jgi:hypothetical protein
MRSRLRRRRLPARSPLLLLVATVASVSWLACASGPRVRHKHEFKLAPGEEHGPALARALLAPVDATNDKPVAGLQIANERIEDLIATHLESKGIAVERVDLQKYRASERAALREGEARRRDGTAETISAQLGYKDIVPDLLKKLGSDADFIVLADVVIRTALYTGTRTIAWDGVRRRDKAVDLDFSQYGDIDAASLGVWIFRADGANVFTGFGGLENIYRVDRAAEEFVVREDLFEDERNLREGICIAFYPWFGLEEFCSR